MKAFLVAALVLTSPVTIASPPNLSAPLSLGLAVKKDSQAYELLTQLTATIGPRLSATEHGTAAELFVFQKLQGYGIEDVRYEQFPMVSWTRGIAELRVGDAPIPSAAMVYAPAHADLAAELADVGNGTSADYAEDYDKVRGRIALVYLGTLPDSPAGTPRLPRWEKLALAVGHGAIGVVFINPNAGNHLGTGIAGGSAKTVTVAAVMVSQEDGLRLREKAMQDHHLRATLRMDNKITEGFARNVIATIPGVTRPNETVVLGGHLDSLDLATGAFDNGTGAMWVLDVARAFAVHKFRPSRTVQFIFFMGEEEGLLGSYAHVRRSAADGSLSRVRFMVNTDMSVDPSGLRVWGGDPDLAFFESVAADIRKLYPSFKGVSTELAAMSQSSDSQPYIERGVPIADLEAQWPKDLTPCIHAECDTLHWVDPEGLRRSAAAGAVLIAALADAPSTAAHVFDQKETQDYYQAQGIVPTYLGPAPPETTAAR
jgi:Peptidase family M28/PA domain